ncbi:MAG TPA: response regulator, partial [Polyangiaceae bacterium]|nr:response regulator [Polyangiaceae bacterium]
MSRHLRLLMIEDSDDDAALLMRELRRGGYDIASHRVETVAGLERALDQSWDLILCDYRMPELDAPTALATVRGRQVDTPCIIVSGTVGEEHAVAALRSGAQDFILKDNLARLLPAVDRELRDSEVRIKHARAENALRATEASFRAAFELIPDGILIHRANTVVHANGAAASLLGAAQPEELVGQAMTDLFAPADREAMSERERDTSQARPAPPLAEVTMLGLDRRPLNIETATMSVLFEGAPALLSVLRDVSARRELVARTMQVDRMLAIGTIAAGVGHEINNPLAYIMANVTYAAEEITKVRGKVAESGGPSADSSAAMLDEVVSILGEVDDGARRIRDIARDLNAFARNDEATALVDLRAVVNTALRMAAPELRHKARVVRQYEEVPPVRANTSRLGQVFLNLIINAAHAIPGGAYDQNEIVVSIRCEGTDIVAEVRDTGCGISPEHRARLFTPFFTTKPV